MSLYNVIDIVQRPVLTHQLENGSIWIRHFITRRDGKDYYSLSTDPSGNIRYSYSAKKYSYNVNLETGFYDLVRRSYRIAKIVFVSNHASAVPESLRHVIKVRGMGLSIVSEVIPRP